MTKYCRLDEPQCLPRNEVAMLTAGRNFHKVQGRATSVQVSNYRLPGPARQKQDGAAVDQAADR